MRSLLFLITLTLVSENGWSQVEAAYTKQSPKIDTTIFDKEETQLESTLNKEKTKALNQFSRYSQPVKDLYKSVTNGIKVQAGFFADGEYVSNSLLPPQANGAHYKIGMEGIVNIGKFPFNAGVTLNFFNKQFWADYTLVHFNFDTRAFSDKMKSSYLDYLGDINNFYSPEVAEQVLGYKDSLFRMDEINHTLSNKDYYHTLRDLQKQLPALKDSVLKNSLDSTKYARYQAVSDSIEKYKNLPNEYSSLEKYKSNHKDLQSKLDHYESYKDSVQNTENVLNNPAMKQQLEKTGILTKKDKFFAGVQKLGIGRINLDVSDYTIRSQSLYGCNIDYLIKDLYYIGGGLGVASQTNLQFNTSYLFNQNRSQPKFNRFMGYIRFGLGPLDGNHLHFIYMPYGEKFRTDTSNIISPSVPPANSVLSLVYKYKLLKTFAFEGELATSNSNFVERYATFSPFETKNRKSNFNYAVKTTFSGRIEKTATVIGVKFNMVSDNFFSGANPYLRRDIAEYGINLSQGLFDNKLTLTSMLNHNFSGLISKVNKQSVLSSFHSINISALPQARYNLSYNLIKQFVPTSNTGFINHTFNLQQDYTYNIRKVQFSTVFNTNYSISRSTASELNTKNHQLQNSLEQTLLFPKGVQLDATGGIISSKNNTSPLTLSYWAETGNNFTIKSKVRLGYSFKYMKDIIHADNYFVTGMLTTDACKGLHINLSGQYQLIVNSGLRYNLRAQAGISYSFDHTFKTPHLNLKKNKKNFQNDKTTSPPGTF